MQPPPPPTDLANFSHILMMMPENARMKTILEQIKTIEDLLVLKSISEDLFLWMHVFDVVLKWERTNLHPNDYWRTYLMHQFAFGEYCMLQVSPREQVIVAFDGRFRHANAERLEELGIDLSESLFDEFELHLVIPPVLESPLILAYEQYFQRSLRNMLQTVPPDGELHLAGPKVLCSFEDNPSRVEITILTVRLAKKGVMKFLLYLLEKFADAYFPDTVRARDEQTGKQVWKVRRLRGNVQ